MFAQPAWELVLSFLSAIREGVLLREQGVQRLLVKDNLRHTVCRRTCSRCTSNLGQTNILCRAWKGQGSGQGP